MKKVVLYISVATMLVNTAIYLALSFNGWYDTGGNGLQGFATIKSAWPKYFIWVPGKIENQNYLIVYYPLVFIDRMYFHESKQFLSENDKVNPIYDRFKFEKQNSAQQEDASEPASPAR